MAEFTGFKPTWEKHHHDAPTTEADLRTERLKLGQCPTCGAQTHEIKKKGFIRKSKTKVPLTELGETQRGRCLMCHPMPVSDSQMNTSTSSPVYFSGVRSFFPSSSPPAPPPPPPLPLPPPPKQPSFSANKKTNTKVSPTQNSSRKSTNRSAADPPPKVGIFANALRESRSASERTMTNILDMSSCGGCGSWDSKRSNKGWKINVNKKWNRRSSSSSWYR